MPVLAYYFIQLYLFKFWFKFKFIFKFNFFCGVSKNYFIIFLAQLRRRRSRAGIEAQYAQPVSQHRELSRHPLRGVLHPLKFSYAPLEKNISTLPLRGGVT